VTFPSALEILRGVGDDKRSNCQADLTSYPYTDTGNGERLATRFAGTVRYSHPQKCWFIYVGRRWETDQTGEMLQRAKLIARELYSEAGLIEDRALRDACAGWARKCESADRRKAALFCAQSEPGIPVLPNEFDADPFLLNCLNGTVDLKTGAMRPHHRDDLITKIAPVEYDAAARSAQWEDFLAQATAGDRELLDFL
jgi:putative DNA primase/helicase